MSGVTLCVEPNTPPMSWKEFIKTRPRRSIALDGYVAEGPRFNPEGPRANFNHHEGVSRVETRATCAQVLANIRLGLLEAFKDDSGAVDLSLFVDDCDEDVCLAVFLFFQHPLVLSPMNPLLNRLVSMEDMLDMSAGAYPFPQDMDGLRRLMWVFSPYHVFRASGRLHHRDAKEFRGIIDDVGLRIMAYITGRGEPLQLDTGYKIIDTGTGWVMVDEFGANARLGVYGSGIRAFVSARQIASGRWVYSIGRSAIFIRFPIPKILKALNAAEGLNGSSDAWGGSDIIGGSPRSGGSQLPPSEVKRIIEETIRS